VISGIGQLGIRKLSKVTSKIIDKYFLTYQLQTANYQFHPIPKKSDKRDCFVPRNDGLKAISY